MYRTKKWEDTLSKNLETSGFVSLLSKLILKSRINEHILSSIFILGSSSLRYTSLKNFVFILDKAINTSVNNIPLIWKNQFNKGRFHFPSFVNFDAWSLFEC